MNGFLDELQVTPLADGISWRLNESFRYECKSVQPDANGLHTAPQRFITDFASIPKALWAFMPPWQRYGAAAVIHDWLYWSQTTSRLGADTVLLDAMRALGVDDGTANEIFGAVRTFGQQSWDHNTKLKAAGFTRLASLNKNPPYAAAV